MSGDSENGYVVGYFWSPDVFTAAYKNGFFRYFSVFFGTKIEWFFRRFMVILLWSEWKKKKNKKQN